MAFLPPSIPHIHTAISAAVTKAGKLLDSKAKNWPSWSQLIGLLFNLFDVQYYVSGKITGPDPDNNPKGTHNWKFNDTYAQVLIMSNISDAEKMHTQGCTTLYKMWTNLQSIHESTVAPKTVPMFCYFGMIDLE